MLAFAHDCKQHKLIWIAVLLASHAHAVKPGPELLMAAMDICHYVKMTPCMYYDDAERTSSEFYSKITT